MNAIRLTVAQMAWLARVGVTFEVNAQGLAVFSKGALEVVADDDGTFSLWDTAARIDDENMLSIDGSPWACRERLALHTSLRAALVELVKRA